MHRTWKSAFAAMAAILCCLSHQAPGQALPEGKGKAEFVHNCTACHRADMVTRVKKTPEEWKKNVADMAARGADGTQEDLNNVVLYMIANFSTSTPSAASPSVSPVALTSSELQSVNGAIADNGCLICHRIEKQGGYMGPSLNGVGATRTPDQIRTAIVSPHPTLDPKNNLIRLTTADGKTMVVRLLSQDDHSVRVVDASGAIITYAKPELRQFAIVDTNPMPSYQKRLAPEDLNSLVRYLSSLPPLDESIQK